jgi:trimeric autotransporter adhesin
MISSLSLHAVQNQLALFAAQSNFDAVISTAFGNRVDRTKLQLLRQQWLSGNFSVIPDIQVLSQGELGGANGAYAASLDKIFVSSDFLARASESQVTALILEEVGHRLDQLLNGGVDSAGDEGEIFGRLVSGQNLSAERLAALRAENDHGMIAVGGVAIAIEKQNSVIVGTSGNDTLTGDVGGVVGKDNISGLAGDDSISGGNGNDTLLGGLGNDTLIGGGGNDTYVIDADIDLGTDVITDDIQFDGRNTLDFSSTTTKAISVNLAELGNMPIMVATGVGIGLSNLSSIGNIIGGFVSDSLTGDTFGNNLSGGDGNDTLIGGAGNDFIYGENGNDILTGGGDNDGIHGGYGNDNISGGDGNDTLDGGDGNDTMHGGNGNDIYLVGEILVNEINDLIVENINAGNDQVVSSGSYTLGNNLEDLTLRPFSFYEINGTGNSLNNKIEGSDGSRDILTGGIGDDTLIGGGGDDTYIIDADVDFGSDTIIEQFNSGRDTLDFSGTTTKALTVNLSGFFQTVATSVDLGFNSFGLIENLYGGLLADNLRGTIFNNVLMGNAGNDTLDGLSRDDTLDGGAGNDSLVGGGENDILNGGSGNDTLDGGTGNDIYIIDADVDLGTKTIVDTSGFDTLDFGSTTTKAITVSAVALILPNNTVQTVAALVNVIISASSITNVYGGALGDKITGNSLSNTLSGNGGNDSLQGAVGDDVLIGGLGNDTYIIDADVDFGTKTIIEATGSGIDSLDFRSSAIDIRLDLETSVTQTLSTNVFLASTRLQDIENVYGGFGNNRILGNALNNTLTGNIGNDILTGEIGNDILNGGGGNDVLAGDTGNDTLNGGDGSDYFIGGAGDDSLNAGAGDDFIYGGNGNDIYIFDADIDFGAKILGENTIGGIDTLDFRTSAIGINLNLASLVTTQTVAASLSLIDSAIGSQNIENVYGGAGRDTLIGNALDNILAGGIGNDSLTGAAGNDTYLIDADVDLGTDTIIEIAAGGIDTLDFSGTTTKAIAVNLATLTTQTVATGVSLAPLGSIENLYGGLLADQLTGNSFNNILKGGGGNDTLNGGAGNDIYLIDADMDLGTDTIIEIAAGGIDALDFRDTSGAITVDLGILTAQTVAADVNVILTGGSIENLYGGASSDVLKGNGFNNSLLGGGGNDSLNGGVGNDTLTGGAGNDTFYFSGAALTGVNTVAGVLGTDRITDFAVGVDKIALNSSTFTAFKRGGGFAIVTSDGLASTAAALLVYNIANGKIFYNTNGSAAGFGVDGGNFAVLSPYPTKLYPTLAVTDFTLVP